MEMTDNSHSSEDLKVNDHSRLIKLQYAQNLALRMAIQNKSLAACLSELLKAFEEVAVYGGIGAILLIEKDLLLNRQILRWVAAPSLDLEQTQRPILLKNEFCIESDLKTALQDLTIRLKIHLSEYAAILDSNKDLIGTFVWFYSQTSSLKPNFGRLHPQDEIYAQQMMQTVSFIVENRGAEPGYPNYKNNYENSHECQRLLNELKTSQEWLAGTLKSIGDAVIATSAGADPKIVFMNTIAEKLTGWTLKETRGKSLDTFGLIDQRTREPVFSSVKKVIREGTVLGSTHYTSLMSKTGQEFIIDESAAPIKGRDGVVTGVVLVLRDVTDQVRSRAILKQSVEELGKLADAMPQMVWKADTLGILTYTNQRWAEYAGPYRADIWHSIIHPDDLPRTKEIWNESILSGQNFEAEFRLKRHSDQCYRWHLSRAVPFRDLSGEITAWYGSNTDVHEFKTLCEELAMAQKNVESERRKFEAIFVDSPSSMALVRGPQHIFEKANPSYFQILADRPLLDLPILHAIPELQGQTYPGILDRVYATGEPYQEWGASARLRRRPGGEIEECFFDQSYIQVKDHHGEAYGVYIHAVDVTDKVQAQRKIEESERRYRLAVEAANSGALEVLQAKIDAETANSAKSAFLANMSHEIRTPVGAIMGFIDLMKSAEMTREELTSYIAVIDRNSTQLLRIIDDILDLSKVEAGKMLIEHIEFSLFEMLADFSSLMGFKARDKGISFDVVALTSLPEKIISDPTRIRQILTNVVGNAIKFTERGSVRLTLAMKNSKLIFRVQDTGVGIPYEDIERLFQAFHQADSTTTRRFGGTGLGLVLTRRLCHAMGGHFELEKSILHEGSVFVADIQFAIQPGAEIISPSEMAFTTSTATPAEWNVQGQLAGGRILVVEDSPDNRVLMKLILTKAGATVDLAEDGQEGVEMALANTYDLILMDVQMPRMDGHEATGTLRSRGYLLPIVALTAHAMKEEREKAFRSGFTDFLTKPIQKKLMLEMLEVYLRPEKFKSDEKPEKSKPSFKPGISIQTH